MSLADITRDAVHAAVREYDRHGPDMGARRCLGATRSSFLVVEGRCYPSKEIAVTAYAYATSKVPTPGDLTGGEAAISQRLTELGFEVRTFKQLPWTVDELILVCDVVARNGWRASTSESDPDVRRLSELLRSLPIHPAEQRSPSFRNANSVRRKMDNLVRAQPGYPAGPGNGGKLDLEVAASFHTDPTRMHVAAEDLRTVDTVSDVEELVPDDALDFPDITAPEGRRRARMHLAYERNQRLRKAKIAYTRALGGTLACQVCGFDYEATYGERGKDYVECHHVVPLHTVEERHNSIADLALICASCHRMIHRRSPWLTIEELRTLLAEQVARRAAT
jgi:5-methylcytosine-specific restriction protein A